MKTMLKTIFSELVIGNLWHLRVRVLAFFIQLQVVTVFFFWLFKDPKRKNNIQTCHLPRFTFAYSALE